MATWTRRIRRFLLNNGAASPSRPCAGKYGKTSKPPRFTNFGQEPTYLTNHNQTGQLCLKCATGWPLIKRVILKSPPVGRFVHHVHEFDADERGLRRVKRFEP